MKFKFRRYYLYYLARVVIFLFGFLPMGVGLYISGKAGLLLYLILTKYRRITLENLKFALGKEETVGRLRAIARRVFENLGKNAFELIKLPELNSENIDRLVTIKNKEALEAGYGRGRGIIIITAHFGSWELMAATLRLKGYPGTVIGRRIYFYKYDQLLNRLRKLHDVHVIYRDESPRKALKALKDNRIVGIVADQDVDSVDGVFVDFFGHPAYTPVGPAVLARASGASMIPVLMLRENSHHTLVVEEPIQLVDTGQREKDLIENTRRWSSVIESYIRRYPEQWVWMHRRWKTRESYPVA
ncbi:MAG: lysophospholipid acyltransferase family protein [Candidatus Omnitrophota bacterium]|nr:lysophospholipid acyltransferase family protein [Candidatus Omnitrophota bacterium]